VTKKQRPVAGDDGPLKDEKQGCASFNDSSESPQAFRSGGRLRASKREVPIRTQPDVNQKVDSLNEMISAKHREIALRYRRHKRRYPFNFDKLHCGCVRNQIERLIRERHGTLPDTDDRSIYLRMWAWHNLHSRHQERDLQALCCRLGASISPTEIAEEVRYVGRGSSRRYSPRSVGKHLRLTDFERTMYGITNIEAYDVTPEERKATRRAVKILKQRQRRRAKGVKPRNVYLENSFSRDRPWEKKGVSRRTWERCRLRLATPNGLRLATTQNRPVASLRDSTLLPVVGGDRLATSPHDKKGVGRGRAEATVSEPPLPPTPDQKIRDIVKKAPTCVERSSTGSAASGPFLSSLSSPPIESSEYAAARAANLAPSILTKADIARVNDEQVALLERAIAEQEAAAQARGPA
jgi:hypothetical protein